MIKLTDKQWGHVKEALAHKAVAYPNLVAIIEAESIAAEIPKGAKTLVTITLRDGGSVEVQGERLNSLFAITPLITSSGLCHRTKRTITAFKSDGGVLAYCKNRKQALTLWVLIKDRPIMQVKTVQELLSHPDKTELYKYIREFVT